MPYLLNLLYLSLLLALSPYLAYKALTTGKYRRGLASKLRGKVELLPDSRPRVWFHGVSVGEIHLLRQVVAAFRRRHPGWECVISTTTDTGFEEARKRFPDLQVFYWPLDFSWAVHRALMTVRPSLIVLAEGEIWPNFLLAAKRLGLPVSVINGRMSPRSFARYVRLRWLTRRVFPLLDLVAVQTEAYAECFRRLGALPERVCVTGSVKYDGVESDRHNLRTEELRRLLAVEAGDLIWIAGSTQAPEEQIALDIYRRAREVHAALRLILVPRQRERFEEVARILAQSGLPFLRRSELAGPVRDRSAIVLVDTIGELGGLWGLADVAFVGGSLDGKRGGQNMIEPAAYGAAVVFGPHVWNFRDTAERLTAARGAVQVENLAGLERVLSRLFDDPAERLRLGSAARRLVVEQRGATERTVEAISLLTDRPVDRVFGAAI